MTPIRSHVFATLLFAFTTASTATAQDLLIENVSLLDGTGGPAVAGMWVAVEDGASATWTTRLSKRRTAPSC